MLVNGSHNMQCNDTLINRICPYLEFAKDLENSVILFKDFCTY